MTTIRRAHSRAAAFASGLALLSIACGLTSDLPFTTPPTQTNDGRSALPPVTDSAVVPAWQMAQALRDADIPVLDESDWQARTGLLTGDPSSYAIQAPDFRLGDRDTFFVDSESSADGTISASLQFISEHAYFWVADDVRLSVEDIRLVANRFESEAFHAVRDIFGSEPTADIDGDPRIHILHARRLGRDILGYVTATDRYSRQVIADSNEREIIYVNVDLVDEFADDFHIRTLAHEFEHIMQANIDSNENSWTDEGLAQVAERIAGFDDLNERYDFLSQTTTPLDFWPVDEDNFANYGSAYLFYLYVWEQLGEDTFSRIATNSKQGLQAVSSVLAESDSELTLEELFGNWTVANVANDPTIAAGQFGYQTSAVGNVCPLQQLASNPYKGFAELQQFTAAYYQLHVSGQLSLSFEGNTLATLIPGQPASGQGMWWAMRGDNSNARLTRQVDLSGVSQATLTFNIWHDLEEDFDAAYLTVSTDNGSTWEALSGRTSLSETAYYSLPAFTGKSGNGLEANWIQEQVGLERYAGQSILLRFEVVSDTFFTAPGIAIDDIAVPEIDFLDSAETRDEGWLTEGWLHTSNIVPQHWSLHLVTHGNQTKVIEIPLDVDNVARWTGTLPEASNSTTLVISASAPAATSPAAYALSLSGDFSTENQGEFANRCG